MVTLMARNSRKETRAGHRLAERMEPLIRREGGMEVWTPWSEVKKRCGHRLTKEGVVCDTGKRREIEEERQRNDGKQTYSVDPYDYIHWRTPESKKDMLEPKKNLKKNLGNFSKHENCKYRNISVKQKEIPLKREYKSRRAPKHSSLELEGKKTRKERKEKKRKEQEKELARRRENYTGRRSSWNQRKTPGFKKDTESKLHNERCTSLFVARPHPTYRWKGETRNTSKGLKPDHSSWDHTWGYDRVRRSIIKQRKHPEDQALRDREGSTDPESGSTEFGRTQTITTHQEGRTALLNYISEYFRSGLECTLNSCATPTNA